MDQRFERLDRIREDVFVSARAWLSLAFGRRRPGVVHRLAWQAAREAVHAIIDAEQVTDRQAQAIALRAARRAAESLIGAMDRRRLERAATGRWSDQVEDENPFPDDPSRRELFQVYLRRIVVNYLADQEAKRAKRRERRKKVKDGPRAESVEGHPSQNGPTKRT